MCNKKNEVIDLNSSALYLKQLILDQFLLIAERTDVQE